MAQPKFKLHKQLVWVNASVITETSCRIRILSTTLWDYWENFGDPLYAPNNKKVLAAIEPCDLLQECDIFPTYLEARAAAQKQARKMYRKVLKKNQAFLNSYLKTLEKP